MPCQEIKSWAFDELVGAYLDLAIAYSLLCASTFAFFAEKFLGLFGLRLPCPCNGLFGDHNRNKCWRRVLADRPSENISSVLFSTKSRFPFDSMCDKHLNFESSVGTINEVNCGSDNGGLEGEAWCGSLRERKSGKGVERSVVNVKEGKLDVKERGFSIQKGRYLRRRRQVAADKGLFSSVSSYDHSQSNSRTHPQSPASVNKLMNKDHEGDKVPASSGAGALHFEDSKESSMDTRFVGTVCNDFESNEPLDKNKPMEKAAPPDDDLKCNAHGEPCFDGEEKHGIRVLEQASEEEHAACSGLYLELEKERSAAATAADEAMAMILRLQEEKALIEMEARQYHRMIEEKSAYDLEEMNILKEILLRREREKHFLEKEVETYRQVIFGNEELESDVQDIGTTHEQRASSSQYSRGDPFLVLQRISESIDEKEKGEESNKFLRSKVQSIESQSCALAFGKELPIPELDEDESLKGGCIHRHPGIDKLRQHLSMDNGGTEDEFEEKELLSPDNSLFDQLREPQIMESCSQFDLSTRGCNLSEKTISTSVEAQQQSDCINAGHELASKTTETCDQTKIIFPYSCDDSEKHARDSSDAEFDLVSPVHDVHVIDDKTNLPCGINENGSEKLSVSAASDIPRTCGSPRISWAEQDVRKSCSDMTNGLPPLVSSKGKFLTSDLRRNSMSAVDYERYKIDSEVGWLRERLRIIQVGREQLNISMENREKKKFQLQHLENTVSQLREIQQSTEHGKAVRQASLPPLSYKFMSKKRQWRSASLGVHRST
uniref:GTD-binding domain-containing protein n=1 Tax=Populus davidiana TaxID=266767 RepID=A0A6M2EIQ3_9ROSI